MVGFLGGNQMCTRHNVHILDRDVVLECCFPRPRAVTHANIHGTACDDINGVMEELEIRIRRTDCYRVVRLNRSIHPRTVSTGRARTRHFFCLLRFC